MSEHTDSASRTQSAIENSAVENSAVENSAVENSAVENRTTESLVALVEAARDGDEEAWAQLHAEFTPLLRNIAARYRLSAADAADAIQATWSKCFENLARLREPAALPGWLSTICRREALHCLRARAKCVPVDYRDGQVALAPLTAGETPAAGDPLATIVDSETHRLLRSLLDELGQRDRNLMRTLIDPDVSYRRIAELMVMPIGSIGPTRQRIIARLRQRARVLDIAA